MKYYHKVNNCVLLGSRKLCNLTKEEIQCLQRYNDKINNFQECKQFRKMIYDNNCYTTCTYLKSQKNKNSIIETKCYKYGTVTNICKIKYNEIYQVIVFFLKIIVQDDDMMSHFKIVNSNQLLSHNALMYTDHI